MAKKAASFAALGGLVFSTDAGRHCPDCRQPVDACTCKQTLIPEGDGIARVRRESKGRGGKTVTTITGVPLAEDALKELATTLKKRCGTGGALKDGIIEIQATTSSCCWPSWSSTVSKPRSRAVSSLCESHSTAALAPLKGWPGNACHGFHRACYHRFLNSALLSGSD